MKIVHSTCLKKYAQIKDQNMLYSFNVNSNPPQTFLQVGLIFQFETPSVNSIVLVSTHSVLQVILWVVTVDQQQHFRLCQVNSKPVGCRRTTQLSLVCGCHIDTDKVAVMQVEVVQLKHVDRRCSLLSVY